MTTVDVADGPKGFEQRTFKCSKCARTDTRMLAIDPLNSDALGWLSGELGRQTAAAANRPAAALRKVAASVRNATSLAGSPTLECGITFEVPIRGS